MGRDPRRDRGRALPHAGIPHGLAAGEIALIVSTSLASTSALLHDPSPLIAIVVLLAALVVVQRPLLDAEIRWRRDAVLDLTGLLNRQGLKRRFREVAEQARLPNAGLARDGRPRRIQAAQRRARPRQGDAVLKDVAYLLRKELRSFELLYRIGGEELLLILPGAELTTRARSPSRHAPRSSTGGPPACRSLHPSERAAHGQDIDFQTMFQAADSALYEAKRAGETSAP